MSQKAKRIEAVDLILSSLLKKFTIIIRDNEINDELTEKMWVIMQKAHQDLDRVYGEKERVE